MSYNCDMRPIDADYRQTMLFPPSLEDFVGADHPARYIREFADLLRARGVGIEEFDREIELEGEGRPPYSVWLLLKIWLLAYALRLRTSRSVEQACRDLLPMMWIAGMHQPDHNTLWRFWRKHQSLVRELFRESVRVAMELGLVDFALHAIDGTKIQAAGSTRKALTRKQIEQHLRRLDQSIAELEQQIGTAGESGGSAVGQLTEQLQNRKKLRDRIEQALAAAPDNPLARHSGEPEARLMKGCGLGYNAQTVVDGKNEIIVTTAVVNDQNDTQQLVPMIERVEQEYSRVALETVADGGYNTAQALASCEDKNYPVILAGGSHEASASDKPYHASKFRYEKERDVVICPEGTDLTFEGEHKPKKSRYTLRRYRGRSCDECPVRSFCTKDRRGRSIDLPQNPGAVARQREKRKDPAKAALLKRRLPVAERPFGRIKHGLGFGRFKAKGLAAAETEWLFVCLLHNIQRIFAALRFANFPERIRDRSQLIVSASGAALRALLRLYSSKTAPGLALALVP